MKYDDYPGDVNTPMPLQMAEADLPEGWHYGDIVTFGEVEGKTQLGIACGIPFTIHPEQKYVLTKRE